jgi:flavin reductase (DIM6/NTAB) family NADH-FMN oxidoreductase RutF
MTTPAPGPDILSAFWSPLCAIGSHGPHGPNAQICVSVFGASIVPDRPRLLVVLHKTNYTHDLVAASGTLAITALSAESVGLLEPLGLRSGRDGMKLGGLSYECTANGDPYFPDGVAMLDCAVLDSADLGDATSFLVAVRARRALGGGEPLGWQQAKSIVGEEFLRRWAAKSAVERAAAARAMTWRD